LVKKREGEMTVDVFIHIPKTGGKSIESLLFANYDKEKMVPIYRTGGQELSDVVAKYPKRELAESQLIYGHFPHRIEELIDRPCSYFTVLRDPVDRFLSFYRFVKYDFKVHPLHQKLQSGEKTIEDIIGPNHPESNMMTKLLAGYDAREKLLPEMLDEAKKNIDGMKCFGIQEKFDASCLLLAKKMGWFMPFYQRTNVSSVSKESVRDAGEITPSIIRKIRQVQYSDEELYEYAKNKFDNVCLKEGIDESIVSNYGVVNRLLASCSKDVSTSYAKVSEFLKK